MITSTTPQRRRFKCHICGAEREILTRQIEKWVVVCLHLDTRGTTLPVMQLLAEGELIVD